MKTEIVSDKELYKVVSRRIAFHIRSTTDNVIAVDKLMLLLEAENLVPSSANIPWSLRQVKNDMLKKELLYTAFIKPRVQVVGLSLRGKQILP